MSSLDVGFCLELLACLAWSCAFQEAPSKDFCESQVELADCWTQTWCPVLSVSSALALALVPCVLSALPPEACSVADALAESGLTTCRQCGLFSSFGTAPWLLPACGCGLFCHFALCWPVTVVWLSIAALPLQLICLRQQHVPTAGFLSAIEAWLRSTRQLRVVDL